MNRLCNEEQVQIRENIKVLQDKIAEATQHSGREQDAVRLMAVTKTVEPQRINCAIDYGISLIGENRVQEFLGKKDALRLAGVQVHLIGHLQTNKVRDIIGQVDAVQSVDSRRLALALSNRAAEVGVRLPILLEVNIANEKSKFGFSPGEVQEAACEIAEYPALAVCGLMTVAPFGEEKAKLRTFFANMHRMFLDIGAKKSDNIHMHVLSMGMSDDYQEAVMEGATLVRVGSAIFGNRILK